MNLFVTLNGNGGGSDALHFWDTLPVLKGDVAKMRTSWVQADEDEGLDSLVFRVSNISEIAGEYKWPAPFDQIRLEPGTMILVNVEIENLSSGVIKKSSNVWEDLFAEKYPGFYVSDPDGWDRANLSESMDEKITEAEFLGRVSRSTSCIPPAMYNELFRARK